MKIVFVDTNVLLHCRPLEEVDWLAIADPEDHVRLLVSPQVRAELDNHKRGGHQRKARRARAWVSRLRQFVTSPESYVIRERSPRVDLGLPPPTTKSISVGLDPDRPDHRLIAEVRGYASEHSGGEPVSILSDDTNLLLDAPRFDLNAIEVPEDWIPNERDKEKEDLRRRLKEYERREARIEASIANATIHAIEYTPLTDEQVEEMVATATAAHPMQTDFGVVQTTDPFPVGMFVMKLTSGDIRAYEESYTAWVEQLRKAIRGAPERCGQATRCAEIHLCVRNIGGAPARDVRLKCSPSDGLALARRTVSNELRPPRATPFLPAPPVPPRPRRVGETIQKLVEDHRHADIRMLASTVGRSEPHDHQAWYRVSPSGLAGPAFVDEFEWKCDQFPHQQAPFETTLRLLVQPGKNPNGGRVRLQLSASNLVKAVEVSGEVDVSTTKASGPDLVREALKRLIERRTTPDAGES